MNLNNYQDWFRYNYIIMVYELVIREMCLSAEM